MRHIMVINPKGGCGKTTLATNIACYYATEGASVVLADFDTQRSSLDWLELRSDRFAEIQGLAGFEGGLRGVHRNTDVVVIDAPARVHGRELTDLLHRAETLVVPVLPSTIDMKASKRFLDEMYRLHRVGPGRAKLALVANRVRENTLIFDALDEFLEEQRAPYTTALREAQNYVRAYTRGMGIFELPEYLAWPDWEQWEGLLDWLESRRSRP